MSENRKNDQKLEDTQGTEQSTEQKPAAQPLTAAESMALDQSVSRQESANARVLNAQKRVKIMIPAGRSKHEQCPVSVGVNGRAYLIERGVEVAVPESVVHVLRLAVEQAPIVEGERVIGFRTVPRYPMQVIGEAE